MFLRRVLPSFVLVLGTAVLAPLQSALPASAAPSGSFTALSPVRILDTRSTGVTIDGVAQRGGALGPEYCD